MRMLIEENKLLIRRFIEEIINTGNTDEIEEFVLWMGQSIIAKEVYEAMLDKKRKVNYYDSDVCHYFSQIGNYNGYALKYIEGVIRGEREIRKAILDVIVAVDEPQIIELLMKYPDTNNKYWVNAMIFLTRHTFGSWKEDCKLENWKIYLKENLPTK